MRFILLKLFMLIKEMVMDILAKLEERAIIEDIKKEKEKLHGLTTKDSDIDSKLDNRLSRYRGKQRGGRKPKV